MNARTLRVASAFPDPPFEVEPDGGFDIELMRRVCAALGFGYEQVQYAGPDFNGIFRGLSDGRWDAVISGTTITPERARVALFTDAYAEFNQGVAVNVARHPGVTSTEGLKGMTLGIQRGNTSDIVARQLLAAGKVADIRYYPYSGIGAALADLESGAIGAVIKLHPVLGDLVKGRKDLAVVCEVATHERIAIAVPLGQERLCGDINRALAGIMAGDWFRSAMATAFGREGTNT